MITSFVKRYITKILISSKILKLRTIIPAIAGRYFFLLFGSPRGIESIKNLQVDKIYTNEIVKNDVPKTDSNTIHNNFTPERKYPHAFLLYLNNGFSTNTGYTISKSGNIILETSYEALLGCYYPQWNEASDLHNYSIWCKVNPLPDIQYFNTTVASLTTICQSNYYHWLFDVLPRIHLLRVARIQPELYYVDNKLNYQSDSLKMLGIHNEQIIDAADNKYIQARRLIIPSIPGIPGIVPKWACEYIRNVMLTDIEDHDTYRAHRHIYISRANARYRKVLNESEIQNILEKYNFKTVNLENMTLSEQVSIFSRADVVVSPHGAGLSNIVFCNNGTKVLEIFPPHYVNPCYWNVAQNVGLDYYYFLGRQINKSEGNNEWDVKEDIIIDSNKFESLLVSIIT